MRYEMREETKKVLLAARDFVNVCYEIEEEYDVYLGIDDYQVRFEDKWLGLDCLEGEPDLEEIYKYSDEANCTVEELTDGEFMDGAILCEGNLYEYLYYYESGAFAYFNEEATKELYKRLRKALAKYGFQLDLTRTGTVLLQPEENVEKQLKRDFGEE